MKKVYTITFHRANNYGAMLQAYALQEVLKERYNTRIIDYDCSPVYNDYKLIFQKSPYFVEFMKKNLKCLIKFPFYYPRYRNFNAFRKKMFITKKYNSLVELKNDPPLADAYVCGSDQIWNPKITNGFDEAFFLKFGNKDVKRISYAASIGNISIIEEDEDKFFNNLSEFDKISVREEDFNNIINSKFKKKSKLVLDPTLLLTKQQWLKFYKKNSSVKEKYIFAYSVGNANENYYNAVNKIAELTGYLIVFFDRNDKDNKFKFKKKSYYSAGPAEFITLLSNSEFVVTTSFHGLALSLILNKKFTICLSSYPSRIISLLKIVNLSARICTNEQDLSSIYNSDIDWNRVNKTLIDNMLKSKKWLFDSIEK